MALFVLSLFVWIVVRGRTDDYLSLVMKSSDSGTGTQKVK